MQAVRITMPFANEVANVLTSSGVKLGAYAIFSGLYKDLPKTKAQKLSKVLIDLIALVGIILNVAYVSSKYGQKAGIAKGIIIVLVAFVLPNLTFHGLIHRVCYRCKPWQKLVFGLLLIGGLSGIEFLLDYLIVEKLHEEKEESAH